MSETYLLARMAVIGRVAISVATIAASAYLLAGEMWLQAAMVACLGYGLAGFNVKLHG